MVYFLNFPVTCVRKTASDAVGSLGLGSAMAAGASAGATISHGQPMLTRAVVTLGVSVGTGGAFFTLNKLARLS